MNIPNIISVFNKKMGYSELKNPLSSVNIVSKYPDKIPVILLISPKVRYTSKTKLLLDKDASVHDLLNFIRPKIEAKHCEGIFLYVENRLLCATDSLYLLYNEFVLSKPKGEDNQFLYITIGIENTFGNDFLFKYAKVIDELKNQKFYPYIYCKYELTCFDTIVKYIDNFIIKEVIQKEYLVRYSPMMNQGLTDYEILQLMLMKDYFPIYPIFQTNYLTHKRMYFRI